ncbi:MAG: hypothetical protein ACTSRL_13955 [Candidatus Helarchaeota archaeon]
MSLIKYTAYLIIILTIAFLFEQIVTAIRDLTAAASGGELAAYLLLGLIYSGLYIIARTTLNERIHPKSSKYIFYVGLLHIGGSLAVFLGGLDPLMLLIFPVLGGFFLWAHRYQRSLQSRYSTKPQTPILEFIDANAGICVLRSTGRTYILYKFFELIPPLSFQELLSFLYREQVIFTYEIYNYNSTLRHLLCLLSIGQNFHHVYNQFILQANRLRTFLRKQRTSFLDISDYLNALEAYYAPLFLQTPTPLNAHGVPTHLPAVTYQPDEVILQVKEISHTLTLHTLNCPIDLTPLYNFLPSIKEPYYLQILCQALSEQEVNTYQEGLYKQYRECVTELSIELKQDNTFATANYFFSMAGKIESNREDLAPFLNPNVLIKLDQVKKAIKNLEHGRQIGLWNVELRFLASPILAQLFTAKLNDSKPLIASAYPLFISRIPSNSTQILHSEALASLFPSIPLFTTSARSKNT